MTDQSDGERWRLAQAHRLIRYCVERGVDPQDVMDGARKLDLSPISDANGKIAPEARDIAAAVATGPVSASTPIDSTGDLPPVVVLHSARFRQVANAYPRTVALAYAGGIAAALLDSDEEVAARVAAWETKQGYLSDWQAIGEAERGE